MRNVLAFILYLIYYPLIKNKINAEGVVLSIYGHNPKGRSVERVFKWLLKNGYEFITPEELINFSKGTLNKSKLVWLSFDDGWKDNYYELLPIIEKLKIPTTIFISSKAIDDGYYWIDKARENRKTEFYNKIDELWLMPNKKRKSIVENLPSYKGVRTAMNVDELVNISKSNYIYIANHTHDHVICDTCTIEELKQEIVKCETRIREITGKECIKAFAYPNGNYNHQVISLIQELDYKIAATTKTDYFKINANLLEVPRFVLPDNASFYESILQIYGLWTPFFDRIKNVLNIKASK